MGWVLLIIVLFTIGPAIPPFIASMLGYKVNEANSTVGMLPWLLFYTIPIGIVAFVIWLIVLAVSIAK